MPYSRVEKGGVCLFLGTIGVWLGWTMVSWGWQCFISTVEVPELVEVPRLEPVASDLAVEEPSILDTPITRLIIHALLSTAPVSTLTANQLPLVLLFFCFAIVWSVPVLS